MSTLNECSICNEPFLFTAPGRQALCLPCGHSACRSCLSRIQTPHCPSCRASFTGNVATMAPNFSLHEVLAATSSSTVATLSGVAAHVAVISAQVAVLQLDNTRRETLATAAHAEMQQMHVLIQALCNGLCLQQEQRTLHSAQQQLQQQQQPPVQQPAQHNIPSMNMFSPATALAGANSHVALPASHLPVIGQQQWPLLQQLQRQVREHDQLQPAQPEAPQQSQQTLQPPPRFPPLSTTSSTAAVVQAPQSAHTPLLANAAGGGPVVNVTSESLEQLMLQINSSTVPATFDLGGRTLYHQISDQPAASILLTASNVTIRNGTFHQSDANSDKNGPGLHIQGKNVTLESMVLKGGGYGVLVLPGAGARLNSCAVIGSFYGLGVGDFSHEDVSGFAKLEAHGVKVSGCGGRGLSVGRRAQAKVQSCEFMNGGHHGMFVGGDHTSKLVAIDVRASGNRKRGLCVIAQGKAVLTRCNLTENFGGSVFVQELQSVIKHTQCTLDLFAEAKNGGYLHAVM